MTGSVLPSKNRVLLFWILFFAGMCVFLYLIRGILLPFIVGILIAYLLDPAADWLERRGVHRPMATFIIIVSFFLLLVLGGLLLMPPLMHQLTDLAQNLPAYAATLKHTYLPRIQHYITSIDPMALQGAKANAASVSGQASGIVTSVLDGLWKSGMALVNVVSLMFITPIVTFYLLRDWDVFKARVDALLPRPHVEEIRARLHEIDVILSGYIRGQTYVCVSLGLFYALALTLVGLNYGLLIGLLTGLFTFIPYVGMLSGLTVGMLIAFTQFNDSDPGKIGIVLAIFVTGQFIEGNFVTPRVIGNRVGLHPAWLIFGMLAGGAILGFVGILLAVPVTAVAGVLIRHALARYLASPLYSGPIPKLIRRKKPPHAAA